MIRLPKPRELTKACRGHFGLVAGDLPVSAKQECPPTVNFRYPIFLDISGKRCLVTGAGFEIPQKVRGLLDAAADVTYIHPTADPEIKTLAAAGLIRWEQREFRVEDLEHCFLIITDHEDNSEIFRLAEERNVLCNAADDPPYCRFSFGSLHRQGELTVAISTNGWAPAVAVRLRQWLQREVGPEYAQFLELLKAMRPEIGDRIPDFSARKELWYRIVDSEALAMIRRSEVEGAAALLRQMLEEAAGAQ